MTNFQAYQGINALNYSTLKLIDISPRYLQHMSSHDYVESDAYRKGRMFHCAILEPDVFKEKYVIMPTFGDMRTKSAKISRDDWFSELPSGVEPVKADEYRLVMRQMNAVHEHRSAMSIIKGAKYEQSIEWENLGVKCKGRLDVLGPTYIADIKTTRHNSLSSICRDIATYDYYVQLAWYHDACVNLGLIDGLTMPCIIAVHGSIKSDYCDVAVIELSQQSIDEGRKRYTSWLQKYIGCVQSGWWPGMSDQVETFEIPTYKMEDSEG